MKMIWSANLSVYKQTNCHTATFFIIVHSHFNTTMAELSGCGRDLRLTELTFTIWSSTEKNCQLLIYIYDGLAWNSKTKNGLG